MIDCRRNTALCSRALDAPLPWHERAQVRLHLVGCIGCRRFRLQIGLLRTASGRWAAGEATDNKSPPSRGV